MRWAEMKQLRSADEMLKCEKLADVILSVLFIACSNAKCKKIYSLVKKNRTES